MAKYFLLTLWFFPVLAQAQVGSLFGLGPVSAGMGGSSLFQGRSSPFQAYGAPAALGFLRDVEVGVGGVYLDPRLKPFGTLVLNSNGTLGEFPTAGVLPGGAQQLAFAFPLGKDRPLTVGAAIFLPFSTLIRVSGSPVNYPFYPLYTDISRNFFFVVGAGYELFDGWAIGLNFRSTTKSNTLYTLRSDNTVNYSATATEAKGQNRISASLVYDNERARKGAGFPFSAGFMYRAKAGLETRLAVDVSAFVPLQGELTSQPSFSPAEWVLMGSLKAWDNWTFSGDLAWVKWSEYSSPYGVGNINTYVIGSQQRSAGFKDVPMAKVGWNRSSAKNGSWLKKISYRGGYAFQPSPVPDQREDANFIDNHRHGFSLGLGLGIKSPWREGDLIDLDFFGQYNWLKKRDVVKLSSRNVGAPGYSTGGSIWFYGAGATVRF